MSVTVTEKISESDDQFSAAVVGQLVAVGTSLTVVNAPFAAGSSSVSYALAFSHTALKYLILKSTQNMTVVFNLSGGGTVTVNLLAGTAYRWNSTDGYSSNPFSADVTSLAISCTPAAVLTGKVLV